MYYLILRLEVERLATYRKLGFAFDIGGFLEVMIVVGLSRFALSRLR